MSMARYPEGASVRDIVAAADMFNHAIPTHDEVEGAVCRLGTGGWLDLLKGRYRLTDTVPEEVRLWPSDFVSSAERLGKRLSPRVERSAEWSITAAEYAEALADYKAAPPSA
ncbi:MAG: hypothetical protein JWL76_1976 [Thermoleophilia bacterium]|nr:hypothetical protein [Thermoleophilia bacterium]